MTTTGIFPEVSVSVAVDSGRLIDRDVNNAGVPLSGAPDSVLTLTDRSARMAFRGHIGHEPTLRARRIELPVISTFEVVAALVHGAGFNAVVVYRPGSSSVTQSFFDDQRSAGATADVLCAADDRWADFNVHVDDVTDVHAR